MYGFYDEVYKKYGNSNCWKYFTDVFGKKGYLFVEKYKNWGILVGIIDLNEIDLGNILKFFQFGFESIF